MEYKQYRSASYRHPNIFSAEVKGMDKDKKLNVEYTREDKKVGRGGKKKCVFVFIFLIHKYVKVIVKKGGK